MTSPRRVQVGIVGAGPAGLLLSHMLDLCGVESVVLEARAREDVETTVRAGVLEQTTVDLLTDCGLGGRLQREGIVHEGVNLRFGGKTHRIDFHRLTGGRGITIYAQHDVLRDLIAAADAAGREVLFEAMDVRLHDIAAEQPRITYRHEGRVEELRCDYIAGCDGFHGVSRSTIPEGRIRSFEERPRIGWLGVLVDAPRSSDELIYACHERGFALVSTRSPTVQRLYVQCGPEDSLADWPDERIWDELEARLETRDGWELTRGEITQRDIVQMRSFVAEPMQYGRLFLAGDAAHIVPPTGAKGLNLAVADVSVLAPALASYFETGRTEALDAYSATCLPRVWRAQRFSSWMTAALHSRPEADDYNERLQLAELKNLVGSDAAMTNFAENYTGVPLPEAALRMPWSELAARAVTGPTRSGRPS